MSESNIENVVDTGATPQADAPAANVDSRTEDQMLADIMRVSDFTSDLYPQAEDVPAPEDTNDDDDLEVSPVIEDEVVEEALEEEVPGEDDTSTQPVYGLDELDEFLVKVKIDGEESAVTIEELVKSYQTDQHLSNKGRELGDARKALDEERETKLGELDGVVGAAAQMLAKREKELAEEYHSYTKQIEEARAEDDTYRIADLKDKQDVAQQKYWAARNERDEMVATAQKQKDELANQKFNEKLQHFAENIEKLIPDWTEDLAGEIRQFAESRGISADTISNMVDPAAIKVLDDLRRFEMAREKGVQKREKAPVKTTPTKKAMPLREKQSQANDANRARVLSGEGSQADNDAFLRNLAARHFD